MPAAASQLAADIEAILGPPTEGARQPNGTPLIQRLRTTHHELARLLALGYKDVDISRLTGYSQSRISVLKGDPMFAELLQHYMTQRDVAAIDYSGRLLALGQTAVEIMQERMLETPDDIDFSDLRRAAEFSADRTGFGPSSKVTNTHVHVTPASLQELRAQIQREHQGRVLPRDQQPALGYDASGASGEATPGEAPEGESSKGSSVRAPSPGDADDDLAGSGS